MADQHRSTDANDQESYFQLCYYTLAHPDPAFIHQHVVDAFTAQTADECTKSITLAFALIGIYRAVEKGQSGRQVQRTHTLLARQRQDWPALALPQHRGNVTVTDVLNSTAGAERDATIHRWCQVIWEAYIGHHDRIVKLLNAAYE